MRSAHGAPHGASSGRRAARQRSGFTLVELLVALAVLALGMAVVVPALVPAGAGEVSAAAHAVAAELRGARLRALSSGEPTEVVFDLDQRTLQGVGGITPLPDTLEVEFVLAGADRPTSAGVVRFMPDGSSSGGRITLGASRAAYVVDVNWFTGRIDTWPHRP